MPPSFSRPFGPSPLPFTDLRDDPVEIGVGGAFDVEIPSADVVDGLVVDHEGAVRVLERGVRRQDRVVRLHHCGRDLQRDD